MVLQQANCCINADCEGHGTHVAAVAGGLSFGVAKDATLHAVRILDCEGNGAGQLADRPARAMLECQGQSRDATLTSTARSVGCAAGIGLAEAKRAASGRYQHVVGRCLSWR